MTLAEAKRQFAEELEEERAAAHERLDQWFDSLVERRARDWPGIEALYERDQLGASVH